MDEYLPLISIRVYKLGSAGWCVSLSPGFPMVWPPVKTKAQAMKLAKAMQKAAKNFNPMDEGESIREMHGLIKQELLRRISST